MSLHGERSWAEETFGGLTADRRIVDRLVRMGTRAAGRPHGLVTQVFERSAEREGAFRLLENRRLKASSVAETVFASTVARCRERVLVAVDGSSLSLVERTATRELGGVGAWKDFGRGLLVQTGLAIDEAGVPIGLCGQTWWAREGPKQKRRKNFRAMEGELRHSVALLEGIHSRFDGCATPWYQLDRGFDVWPVLRFIIERHALATVRATGHRFVFDTKGRRRLLRDVLASAPLFGKRRVEIPEGPNRRARTTELTMRATEVHVPLSVGRKRRLIVRFGAVLVKETRAPRGERPLAWMLLTTHPIASSDDLRAIVDAYTQRWRIEDFHQAWKDGLCRVERTQLRTREALLKWATILGAVAVRATRLARLARTDAAHEQPATTEFTANEVEAILLLRQPKRTADASSPSLAEAVRWVADLGGYTGKSSGA